MKERVMLLLSGLLFFVIMLMPMISWYVVVVCWLVGAIATYKYIQLKVLERMTTFIDMFLCIMWPISVILVSIIASYFVWKRNRPFKVKRSTPEFEFTFQPNISPVVYTYDPHIEMVKWDVCHENDNGCGSYTIEKANEAIADNRWIITNKNINKK
jgi:hypothetical protein